MRQTSSHQMAILQWLLPRQGRGNWNLWHFVTGTQENYTVFLTQGIFNTVEAHALPALEFPKVQAAITRRLAWLALARRA